MKGYWALARATALGALAYRTNFMLGLGGVFVQLVASLAVWRVVLAQSAVQGFTWPQMRAYLLVAFASGTLVSLFGNLRMAFRIQNGDVALDLVKPIDYQRARFAETIGAVCIEVPVVLVVGGATIALTGDLRTPDAPALALFLLSMVLLVPLKFVLMYSTTLLCFWTQSFLGVQWARLAIINLFSGALIPLVYLPHWLGTAAQWSPFAGLTSTPALIFIGRVDAQHGLVLVSVQFGWTVVLWFAARLIWRSAVRQLTVNGG